MNFEGPPDRVARLDGADVAVATAYLRGRASLIAAPLAEEPMGVRGGMGAGRVAAAAVTAATVGAFWFGQRRRAAPEREVGLLAEARARCLGRGRLEGVGCWTSPGMCTVSIGTDFAVLHWPHLTVP